MDPLKLKKRGKQPEAVIQDKIVMKLRYRGWFVKETHGSVWQSGLPDIYAANRKYGPRWIEVKNPNRYRFTPAQLEDFPQFSAAGVGIWILVSDEDSELDKLFSPPNWHTYLQLWKESPLKDIR